MKSVTRFFISVAMTLVASGAYAAPQGAWPDNMMGKTLPKQSWIMVIPAERMADGGIKVWDRSDAWNESWLVPRSTPSGVRTVAVNGDADDKRMVSSSEIDGMSVAALSALAGKYGADAIAVPVVDANGQVAVAAWARGGYATWSSAPMTAAASEARGAALALMDTIFSGGGSKGVSSKSESVQITGQRFNAIVGADEYRIAGRGEVLDALAASPNIVVTGRENGETPALHVTTKDGRDVAAVLSDMGISIR